MQVRGLPRQIIRNGKAASRLLAAKTPNIEAERRRDAVARWRRAMTAGLTAEQAAQAVGQPRSTLYRWEKAPEPRSRRPKRLRQPRWPPALVEAVEAIRADNPMWGKRKIAALLGREGRTVSLSKVGRILKRLMERGVVVPTPILRRRPDGRRFRFDARQRYAKRLAKGRKAQTPGELVQIDTLFVNVRPDRAIKPFTAYDPVAKWTVGHVAAAASASAASALLDPSSSPARPSRSAESRSTAGRSSCPSSRSIAATKASSSSSCRPSAPTSTDASSVPSRAGDTSSMLPMNSLAASTSSSPSSTHSPIDTTTTGPTRPLAISPQPSISLASAKRPRRLIWAEPAQIIDKTRNFSYTYLH
jgi:transposase